MLKFFCLWFQLDSSRQDENLRASELLQEAQEASSKVEVVE